MVITWTRARLALGLVLGLETELWMKSNNHELTRQKSAILTAKPVGQDKKSGAVKAEVPATSLKSEIQASVNTKEKQQHEHLRRWSFT